MMQNNVNIKMALINGTGKIILPVNPSSFDVVDGWNNVEANINSLGLINMIGNRGLKSVTISSFFPAKTYDFTVSGGTVSKTTEYSSAIMLGGTARTNKIVTYHPWQTIKKLQSWRGKVLTFSISGTDGIVSWRCLIDGDIQYGEKDGTGDVYYTLTLKEYKSTNKKRTVTVPVQKKKKSTTKKNEADDGRGRAVARPGKYKYTTKKGDTLKKIAFKVIGKSSKASSVYKQNKKAIKKAFKKYNKKLSSAEKKKYKKLSKYNKPLPKGVKLVIKI